MENWKPINGFPDYAISDHGRVRSLKRGIILKPWQKPDKSYQLRYLQVELWLMGRRYKAMIHHLVLEAFRGPRPARYEARHLDGDPQNNNLSNLEWGTFRENLADRRKHMTKMALTAEMVRYIRLHPEKSVRALAHELGCAKSTVHIARTGLT